MASTSSNLAFKVQRCEPELVVPAKPTPREFKNLSDVDNQEGMRSNLTRSIWFYKNNNNNNPSMEGKDPVKVIREALGRALVYYYPFAGRLMEGSDKKLMVDCNGQGMLFIEANADVIFEQLGHTIQPPFPFLDEVLYNVPGSDGIIGCPMFLFQVTRLICGSFILGVRLNHTMCDAFGMCQFMKAVGEMARGAQHPSVPPVWQRELLDARNPPRISTRINHEYQQETGTDSLKYLDQTDMVQQSFIFTPNQIRAIRKHLPQHLASSCSQFELLTACIWRCRTLALNLDPEEVVQVNCVFSARGKSFGLNLPLGYYGNAVAFPAAASKAGLLCKNPLQYAVELVKKAKSDMNIIEHMAESAVDLMLIKGRPAVYIKGNYFVSDLTKVGFGEIDFGWGYPEYAGPPMSYPFNCYYIKYGSKKAGGILVPICLPLMAMERFQQELKEMIEGSNSYQLLQPANIKSML